MLRVYLIYDLTHYWLLTVKAELTLRYPQGFSVEMIVLSRNEKLNRSQAVLSVISPGLTAFVPISDPLPYQPQ